MATGRRRSELSNLLTRYLDGVIEAGWLTALAITPLLMNPHESQPFETPKVALVRVLAVVMLAAWVLRAVEAGAAGQATLSQPPFQHGLRVGLVDVWQRCPLAVAALGVLAATVLSTLTSISPTTSLLGSHERGQGLMTTLAYVVIFLIAAATVRSKAALERAISAVLVASLPVAGYGIIQRYRLDPMDWPTASLGPDAIASTLGNPIFLAAYLAMVAPLTLGRVLGLWEQASQAIGSRPGRFLFSALVAFAVGVPMALWIAGAQLSGSPLSDGDALGVAQAHFSIAFGSTLAIGVAWALAGWRRGALDTWAPLGAQALLFALQVSCVLLTQRRGPFLALLAGLLVSILLYALLRRARRAALAIVAGGICSLALLGLLQVAGPQPGSPLASRLFERIFEAGSGTGRVRVLIWEGVLQLGLPHAPLWSPTVGDDPLNPVRPLVGYGPESLGAAYGHVHQAELVALQGLHAIPDRAHNATLDALAASGLLGLAAYLGLITALFTVGLERLGFFPTARMRRGFLALWFAAAAAASLLVGPTLGWHLLALTLPGGMMLGLAIYLAIRALRGPPPAAEPGGLALTLAMVVAALLSHTVEVQLSFAVTATALHFWVFAALLVARRPRDGRGADAPLAERTSAPSSAGLGLLPGALVTGLVLAVFAFGVMHESHLGVLPSSGARLVDLLAATLLLKATPEGARAVPVLAWVVLATLLLGLTLAAHAARPARRLPPADWASGVGVFVAVALALAGVVALPYALLLARSLAEPEALVAAPLWLALLVLGGVLALGAALVRAGPRPEPLRFGVRAGIGSLAALGVALLGLVVALGPAQADVVRALARGPRYGFEASIDLAQRALAMEPPRSHALILLGASAVSAARTAPRDDVAALLNRAERASAAAHDISPFDAIGLARLADVAHTRADLAPDPATKLLHLARTLTYYEAASLMSPHLVDPLDRYAAARREYAALVGSGG